MQTVTIKFIVLAGALSLSAVGSAVASSSPDAPRQQVVQFSDLNLSTPAGNSALYRRIQKAAKSVCDARDSRQVTEVVRARAYMETAIKEAVFAVNDPALTQRYIAAQGQKNSLIAQASR